MYEQVALVVGHGAYGAFQSHGNNTDGFTQLQLGGLDTGLCGLLVLNGQLFVFIGNFTAKVFPGFFQILHGCAGACLLKGTDSLIGCIFGILKDFTGLFIGLPQNAFFCLVNFFLFGFQLLFEGFHFSFVGSDLQLFFLYCNTALLQIGKQIFKAFSLRTDLGAGGIDNIIGKAQP